MLPDLFNYGLNKFLGFQGDDLAIAPDIDGRAVHAGGFARRLCRAAQSTTNYGCEILGWFLTNCFFSWLFLL